MNTPLPDWWSRWQRECEEWQAIKEELLSQNGTSLTAYDVSKEQRRRMVQRGERPMRITRIGVISEVPPVNDGGSP